MFKRIFVFFLLILIVAFSFSACDLKISVDINNLSTTTVEPSTYDVTTEAPIITTESPIFNVTTEAPIITTESPTSNVTSEAPVTTTVPEASYVTTSNEPDIIQLLDCLYKGKSYYTVSETGIGSVCYNVRLENGSSFSYYDKGTLHYIYHTETAFSDRGSSIQISSYYGEFYRASINYHISGGGSEYSVGFAYVNILDPDMDFTFISTINKLNLDTDVMLAELKAQLPDAIAEFKAYMEGTLNLPLK